MIDLNVTQKKAGSLPESEFLLRFFMSSQAVFSFPMSPLAGLLCINLNWNICQAVLWQRQSLKVLYYAPTPLYATSGYNYNIYITDKHQAGIFVSYMGVRWCLLLSLVGVACLPPYQLFISLQCLYGRLERIIIYNRMKWTMVTSHRELTAGRN